VLGEIGRQPGEPRGEEEVLRPFNLEPLKQQEPSTRGDETALGGE
jgi:hypothetical protein